MHAHGEKRNLRQGRRQEGVALRPATAVAVPGGLAAGALLALQRTAGNAAVLRALAAQRHVHGAGCGDLDPVPVQRSPVHEVLRSSGRPLDTTTRTEMEARLGADFSDVRIHTDVAAQRSAAGLGARAYTSGNHVVIGQGGGDRHTLAHELVHVIQQSRGPVAGTPTADRLSVSDPSDAYEREAEAEATRALSGPLSVRTASGDGARGDRQETVLGRVQCAPARENLPLQRLAIGDAPATWENQPVRRSGEGADGVYFVGPAGQEVVIKPLWSTGTVEYAHQFLEHMGLSAPRTVRYAANSPEGQVIGNLLRSNASAGRTPTEISDQLDRSRAFLVMEVVQGASLQSMGDNEAQQYLADDAALRQTGRMMVVDAFLGNDDRAVGPRVNLGNFLYQVATDIAPPQIHAVDNDSKFPAPGVATTRAGRKTLDNALLGKLTYIDELRRPADDNPFIARFLTRLRGAHRNSPQVIAVLDDTARLDVIKALISQGITSAFADLAAVFTEHTDLVRAIGSGYDQESAQDRSVSGAKAAAKYIKDTQSGMPQGQAAQQLVAYVEHRLRKDKLPAGLKWITKLIG
jgi:hypothetical protein